MNLTDNGKFVASTFDDDLYKINMQAAAFQLYPRAEVKYSYINRGGTKFPAGFSKELRKLVDGMKNLEAPNGGRDFLGDHCPYLSPAFLDFVELYRFRPDEVGITQNGDDLTVEVEGNWHRAIRWEVPLMATISELYFQMTGESTYPMLEINKRAAEKANFMRGDGIRFVDMGTRRRYSQEVHSNVVKTLSTYAGESMIGTSNVHMAMLHGLKPIGTKAHEFYMFHAAKYGYRMANEMAMEAWIEVFGGNLGVALPDTFTTEAFLRAFSTKFAKLYDGTRQDSGDPKKFTDMLLEHYVKIGVNPKLKSIIYSNDINSKEKCRNITDYARGKFFASSLGIGTWFTNDVGVKPLNHVIKMVGARPEGTGEWIKTIKLGDDVSKNTGDVQEREHAMHELGIKKVEAPVEA